jgi:acetyl esterase/lipase
VQEVEYASGDLKLKAWVKIPNGKETTKNPAMVCFHGGFAFAASDFQELQPFVDAGFVVMTPWLRGQNGMPGAFELFYGEVEDAAAAVTWLSTQPYVDASRMYAFGHSSGGVISAMLSLSAGVPLQYTGSAGGLYGVDIFDSMDQKLVPFDKSKPVERQLRVLPGNSAWMQRPHYAYVGQADEGVKQGVATAKSEVGIADPGDALLQIIPVPGDHHTSYPEAIKRFIELVKSQPSA